MALVIKVKHGEPIIIGNTVVVISQRTATSSDVRIDGPAEVLRADRVAQELERAGFVRLGEIDLWQHTSDYKRYTTLQAWEAMQQWQRK